MPVKPGRKKRRLEEEHIHPEPKPCEEPRCELFGQIHPNCAGHAKGQINEERGGSHGNTSNFRRPCRNAPVEMALYCRPHMGPRAKTVADARVMAAAVTYGKPQKISPHAALLGELYRSQGHVNWLASKVAELDPGTLTWGVISEHDRPLNLGKDGEDEHVTVQEVKRGAAPSVWLELYQKERKHLADVATMCLRANIEERQTRVIEAHAVILARVIEMILKDDRLMISAPPVVQSAVVRDAMDRMELLEAS